MSQEKVRGWKNFIEAALPLTQDPALTKSLLLGSGSKLRHQRPGFIKVRRIHIDSQAISYIKVNVFFEFLNNSNF